MLNAKGTPQTFVIGDIHGAYRALRQCFDRSGFRPASDHLICLGDVADGWPDTKTCIDDLLKIKNMTYLLGNHDLLTLEWMGGRVKSHVTMRRAYGDASPRASGTSGRCAPTCAASVS